MSRRVRLASVLVGDGRLWRAVAEDGFVALSTLFPQWRSLREVIAAGAMGQVAQAAEGRITEGAAPEHVAALTLCNEGMIRDWVRRTKSNVAQGKHRDGSGAMGPWLVPFDDPTRIADMALTCRVNGEVRQADRTGRMIFPVARLIAHISTFLRLEPGDVIVTGTPSGAGARHDPPVWLSPGDVVEETGLGAGGLDDPVLGIVWLEERLARYGMGLAEGDIVLAGSFIRPIEAPSGSRFEADFGPFGMARIAFG